RFPLPDHFCDGSSGLQYLGRTFGYFRRGTRFVSDNDGGRLLPASLTISTRSNFARRPSSSRFFTVILSVNTLPSRSSSCQSSSNGMVAGSSLRIPFSCSYVETTTYVSSQALVVGAQNSSVLIKPARRS